MSDATKKMVYMANTPAKYQQVDIVIDKRLTLILPLAFSSENYNVQVQTFDCI